MGKPSKMPVTLRFSEETRRELVEIAKRQKVSQADVVAVLVHCYYVSGDFDAIDDWFDVARMS